MAMDAVRFKAVERGDADTPVKVLCLCDSFEMIGADASPYSAEVINLTVSRDGAISHLVREPVCASESTANPQSSIATGIDTPSPKPTGFGLRHFGPETVSHRHADRVEGDERVSMYPPPEIVGSTEGSRLSRTSAVFHVTKLSEARHD